MLKIIGNSKSILVAKIYSRPDLISYILVVEGQTKAESEAVIEAVKEVPQTALVRTAYRK